MVASVKGLLRFCKAVYDKYLSPIGLITRQLNVIDSKLASPKELNHRKSSAKKLPALLRNKKKFLRNLERQVFAKPTSQR